MSRERLVIPAFQVNRCGAVTSQARTIRHPSDAAVLLQIGARGDERMAHEATRHDMGPRHDTGPARLAVFLGVAGQQRAVQRPDVDVPGMHGIGYEGALDVHSFGVHHPRAVNHPPHGHRRHADESMT